MYGFFFCQLLRRAGTKVRVEERTSIMLMLSSGKSVSGKRINECLEPGNWFS